MAVAVLEQPTQLLTLDPVAVAVPESAHMVQQESCLFVTL
jgi:hypothetical protein